MLFFFAPAGIETLFDALASMPQHSEDDESPPETLKRLGKLYGVDYLV